MPEYSIYLHIPFCNHRCSYCDFNTFAGLENLIPEYINAICQEIEYSAASLGVHLPVHTIYFGGGTPSLFPIAGLKRILKALSDKFDLLPGIEITLESNPGTVSLPYLFELKALGINRLSLGMQSADPNELRLLGRTHSFIQVNQAIPWARQAGFDNLNLDLIFGLPEQTLGMWKSNLDLAMGFQPEHLSLYALTLEHGTPIYNWVERGLLSSPDPDLAADLYEWASECLEREGYIQYEISNWGRSTIIDQTQNCTTSLERSWNPRNPPFACLHNLQYWRNQPYLGFGAGAHGYANGIRTANVLSPGSYIERMRTIDRVLPSGFPTTPGTLTASQIDRQAEIAETMMMGLRLTKEGVTSSAFYDRFGVEMADYFRNEIIGLVEKGLLEWVGEGETTLRLTNRGRLLGNIVFIEFI